MNKSEIRSIMNEIKEKAGGEEAQLSFYEVYLDPQFKINKYQHRLYAGMGVNLYTRMKQAGADDDELLRGARYTLAAIDCMKLHLNIKQIGKDLGINDLKKKYPPTNGTTEHD